MSAISSQGAEILHASGLIPKKRAATLLPGQVRKAGDLTAVVERMSVTACAPERPQIDHFAVVPEEGIHGWEVLRKRLQSSGTGFGVELVNDHPAICPRSLIKKAALSVPPESAQIPHALGLGPAKRMHLGCSGEEKGQKSLV